MIDLKEENFISAARANLVANTPLFLLKKLRQDSSVIAFSKRHSAIEFLTALEAAAGNFDLPRNSVLPCILLVALSLKNDRNSLNIALSLDAGRFRWYKDIATALIKMTVPKSESIINVPNINLRNSNLINYSNLITKLEVLP